MAKGSRGGKRAGGTTSGAGATTNANVNNPNGANTLNGGGGGGSNDVQVDDTQSPQAMSVDYNNFMAMSDDQKADVILTAIKGGVPAHLSQTDFQALIYNTGLNDKPQLVDDATFNQMKGTTMYRTVNSTYDKRNDIGYTAPQIIQQIQAGTVTRTSDDGGSAHGRGIYFADSRHGSKIYGKTSGNIQKTAMCKSKLNSNAKIISSARAKNEARKEINSGSKLGKALGKCDWDSAVSIYAMCKGYNVIQALDYFCVLNRGAITMSKDMNSI